MASQVLDLLNGVVLVVDGLERFLAAETHAESQLASLEIDLGWIPCSLIRATPENVGLGRIDETALN